jgi:prolipoprotein diacylglyceryltransferase
MYPELFRIGGVVLTSFGLFVGLGAAVGRWVFSRELRRSHPPPASLDGAILGAVGGLAGAKLLYVAEHLGEEPLSSLLLGRSRHPRHSVDAWSRQSGADAALSQRDG